MCKSEDSHEDFNCLKYKILFESYCKQGKSGGSLAKTGKLQEESKLLHSADAKLYAVHVQYNEPRNSTYYLHGDR